MLQDAKLRRHPIAIRLVDSTRAVHVDHLLSDLLWLQLLLRFFPNVCAQIHGMEFSGVGDILLSDEWNDDPGAGADIN